MFFASYCPRTWAKFGPVIIPSRGMQVIMLCMEDRNDRMSLPLLMMMMMEANGLRQMFIATFFSIVALENCLIKCSVDPTSALDLAETGSTVY